MKIATTMKPQNKVHLGLRIPADMRDALKIVADGAGVTVTSVVLKFVHDRLVAEGYIMEEERIDGSRPAGQPPVAYDDQG